MEGGVWRPRYRSSARTGPGTVLHHSNTADAGHISQLENSTPLAGWRSG
jgi:hypothetical protein